MTHPDDFRLHPAGPATPVPGEFVLYWMQATMRAEENFALNWAAARANDLGLPLLVYQGLRHDYPWASDRFHTFILESAADLGAAFARRGIQYALYLDTRSPEEAAGGHRDASPLVRLARRAALVVTDYVPTFLAPRQTKALREKVAAPVVAVDSCTVVPMAYHARAYSTARAIRPRLLEALPHFLHPVGNVEPRVRRPVELPFDPARPAGPDAPGTPVADLVARCAIDHAVTPARAIRGGTGAARRRLEHFLRHGLPRYADARNDPNEDVTSGLSPWLHFGNIGIHEVLLRAREAGPAAPYEKFQDEALTWRELAHNFVHFDRRHRTVAAIPPWARAELEAHLGDPREAVYSRAQLARAETHDELWNACQRAYLRDGTMHNYLRMLWGKSVLRWTRHYADALRILEDLNNRYSLDGRDPNSYGGIHWVLGKFDRPFYRRPVLGTVRYMSLKAARDKFDVPRYVARYR